MGRHIDPPAPANKFSREIEYYPGTCTARGWAGLDFSSETCVRDGKNYKKPKCSQST